MKTLAFILLIFSSVCHSQIINFPDSNFKNALVNTNCVNTNGNGVGDIDADTNNDGEIQESEAEAVIGLNVDGQNISSLEGIQYFTNILDLRCRDNSITNITGNLNPNIEILFLGQNLLTSLDRKSILKSYNA